MRVAYIHQKNDEEKVYSISYDTNVVLYALLANSCGY